MRLLCALLGVVASVVFPQTSTRPAPPGRLIDIGGQRIHLNCSGRGTPTVVIENGLGDFSFDWVLVQRRVAAFARVCSYDRGGYAWSEPGPTPRTFAQLNLELKTALSKAGERGPYVLVGHSFGGGVVRAFALGDPKDTAGLVFVDIVSEQQYIRMGPHAGRVGDNAKGRAIPAPHLGGGEPLAERPAAANSESALEGPYLKLPPREQALHRWAAAQPGLDAVEDSQREWSGEYFARWVATPQDGSLGAIPLIVLTRADGEYGDNLDKPAAELERIRLEAHAALARLSTSGTQRIVDAGHNMHLEAPDVVAQAIADVGRASRRSRQSGVVSR
jgi:pimeloyl-ACP methyl ester carboxylesterase